MRSVVYWLCLAVVLGGVALLAHAWLEDVGGIAQDDKEPSVTVSAAAADAGEVPQVDRDASHYISVASVSDALWSCMGIYVEPQVRLLEDVIRRLSATAAEVRRIELSSHERDALLSIIRAARRRAVEIQQRSISNRSIAEDIVDANHDLLRRLVLWPLRCLVLAVAEGSGLIVGSGPGNYWPNHGHFRAEAPLSGGSWESGADGWLVLSVPLGEKVSLEAIPDDGYEFVKWVAMDLDESTGRPDILSFADNPISVDVGDVFSIAPLFEKE